MENQNLELELINSQIEIWQNKIDQLSKNVNDFKDFNDEPGYLKVVSEIEELQKLINDEKLKIEDLKNHDFETWQIMKEGFIAAWELLKINVEDTFKKLTNK